MVIKTAYIEEKEGLRDFDKEISMLHSLGVEDSEIKYLIYLKRKKEVGLKWQE